MVESAEIVDFSYDLVHVSGCFFPEMFDGYVLALFVFGLHHQSVAALSNLFGLTEKLLEFCLRDAFELSALLLH